MNEDKTMVPYIVYESSETRHERTVKRLVVAIIISIILIFLSNALWLNAWLQYDYTSEASITVDGQDGVANYIGNDGIITNGESDDTKNKDED